MTQSEHIISGDISIHTENIFPIIKKWLYSEHDIFIRELVSNAFDAINKRKLIAESEGLELPEKNTIKLNIDATAKTITISDTGLGLDADDLQKYINQIAFSGAEEFLTKYKQAEDSQPIIGHFGLGFYSAFMVSDKVEINSLSYKPNSKSAKWSCDGSTKFEISSGTRTDVGTDIILFLNAESQEFLSKEKLNALVKKYANFLPVEILVEGEIANHQNPLWMQSPNDVTDEAYKSFYHLLCPGIEDPLFWIHLNVDYPFNLKGILYFPKLAHELDASKGKIQLYCNQVFVTDDAKDIVPEFLTLLQGAIDSPDIPLNVSRSYLQNDPAVKKIAHHIVKKVADKLNEIYKKDKSQYETYWKDIHPFIKYGMLQDTAFYDKMKDNCIFESSAGGFTTLSEYQEKHKETLKENILYCQDRDAQASYVSLCQSQGLDVLYTMGYIDTHFMQFLESKNSNLKFVAVDSQMVDALLENTPSEQEQGYFDSIKQIFTSTLSSENVTCDVKQFKSEDVPAIITEPEYTKRFRNMSMMFQKGSGADFPSEKTLVLNSNHPLIKTLSETKEPTESEKQIIEHIYDMALMAHKPLSGEKMQKFLKRQAALLLNVSTRGH